MHKITVSELKVGESYYIHHIKPVSESGVREVNPATNLVPVCANCHRMIHHHRNSSLTIDTLKEKIGKKSIN